MEKLNLSVAYKPLLMPTIALTLLACGAKQHNSHDHSSHDHGLLDIATLGEDIVVPSISATITEDGASGWNLYLDVKDFTFTPEKVGLACQDEASAANEGHVHLYIDGFKFSRIYSNWYHIKTLPPGHHKLEVTLNANDHSPLAYKGTPISATLELHQK